MNHDEALSARFETAIGDARDLTSIHRSLSKEKRGRRRKEIALNRSVVFVAVAAWQAQVEDVAQSLLDSLEVSTMNTTPLQRAMYQTLKATVTRQVSNYSTLNARNTEELLALVGYDVRSHWRLLDGVRQET